MAKICRRMLGKRGNTSEIGVRDRLLDAADRLFHQEGVRAVGWTGDDAASGLPYLARGFELGPALPSGVNLYVQVLVAYGREQEARDAVANMLAVTPPDNLTWLTEMFVWALDGRRNDIVATLTEERVRWARADLQYSLQLAECFAILSDNDRAFEWLENAIRCGVVNYPFLSARDPYLANLRRDARFEPLMAHVKSIWQRL